MKKVTLIVFVMLSSTILAMSPGLLDIGFSGALGLFGGHGINTGFGFNRFGLGVIGNGYLGYNKGHGKDSGYNNNNGKSDLIGFDLIRNDYGHRTFGLSGFSGFNSLLGVGFGKFGGIYH